MSTARSQGDGAADAQAAGRARIRGRREESARSVRGFPAGSVSGVAHDRLCPTPHCSVVARLEELGSVATRNDQLPGTTGCGLQDPSINDSRRVCGNASQRLMRL